MIEDSGSRTEFSTGAVRDIQEGKGRMDLLPLMVIASLFPEHHKDFFIGLDTFIHTGDKNCLFVSLHCAIDTLFLGDIPTATLEASIHFEEGIKKTVQWYLDHPDWVSHVRSGDYQKWIEQHYG